MTDAQARARIESGERFALRLRAGGERIEFDDRLLGVVAATVDDFVVVRSDGVHAYQLAVVVDDAAQGVGEIGPWCRPGSSTPRQSSYSGCSGCRYAALCARSLGPRR